RVGPRPRQARPATAAHQSPTATRPVSPVRPTTQATHRDTAAHPTTPAAHPTTPAAHPTTPAAHGDRTATPIGGHRSTAIHRVRTASESGPPASRDRQRVGTASGSGPPPGRDHRRNRTTAGTDGRRALTAAAERTLLGFRRLRLAQGVGASLGEGKTAPARGGPGPSGSAAVFPGGEVVRLGGGEG